MSFIINDSVTLTSAANIDNLRLSSNTISSTDTNGDIILAPNGTGTVQTGNLQLDGNTISSTDTNGHIILAPNGTGTVQTGNLQIDGNTISSTDTDGDLLLMPNGVGKVGIETTSPAQTLDINGTIAHKGLVLSEGTTPNVDEIKTFGLFLTVTTTWSDTGISGTDLLSGTYILYMYTYSTTTPSGGGTTSGDLDQYDMIYSGVLSWWSGICTDDRYTEILLHSSGRSLANSGNVIYLRTFRDIANQILKLQIRSSIRNGVAPDGANPNFTLKFRRMI